MGIRNLLIDGVSGSGKTAVAEELARRGCHVVHGDRVLAIQGDARTGGAVVRPRGQTDAEAALWTHGHHVWDEEKVRAIIADQHAGFTFFCGGARNHDRFLHLFDKVFVLEIDADTLKRRLDRRPVDEFGGRLAERALILRLHASKDGLPQNAITIDAVQSTPRVADDILLRCETVGQTL